MFNDVRQWALVHLGMKVVVKLNDGRRFYGRIEGVDQENIYLANAMPESAKDTPLSWVKTVTRIERLPTYS